MSNRHRFLVICVLICLGSYLCLENEVGNGVCVKYNRISRMRENYYCCSNYTADTSEILYYDSKPTCKPICYPGCMNSICYMPGKCRCFSGYTSDPLSDRNCLPECSGCTNGICAFPDVCICNHGYIMTNSGCLPVCTEPCRNGTCVSPETCLCKPGYRTSETNNYICEPYCASGCNNGRCVGPDTCACAANWRQVDANTCQPVCSPSCFNGVCVAPNKCKCHDGYEFSTVPLGHWNYTCLPHPTTSTVQPSVPSTTFLTETTLFSGNFVHFESSVEVPTERTTEHGITIIVENKPIENITDTNIGTNENNNIWIYITVSLVTLVLAILLLLAIVIITKNVFCIKGGSYIVEDRQPKSTRNSYNVTFSSISQKQ